MENKITLQQKEINFIDKGKGKVLVLLHGFLESLNIWNNFIDELSKEFRVIAIDLPGNGKSDCIGDEHSMELMADSVKAVLNHLEIEKCVMIGHSMGGYVTLAFAERYPEFLGGFGLFHSHAAADSAKAKTNRDRTIKLIEKDRKGFIQMFIPDLFAETSRSKFKDEIERLKKQAGNTSKKSIIAALKGMKDRPDRTHILENLNIPILFILGKEDSRIPLNIAIPQSTLAKRSKVYILNNVGHMGFIEAKDKTLSHIFNFLKSV